MDISYCSTQCPIGKQKSEEVLSVENSAYDAVISFNIFVADCSKTCCCKDTAEFTLSTK